ncbi:MAG: 16S rRNA (guanine(966)-N(2))-methyltransferase RsmD [Oscillospiraceae bacterium]|nr:16S rRNA (guanine(966)-N(2))-methyltransferase RsmD [Oscillospiraceae bacterium]
MRVITGSAKGIRLQTLEGLDVRPTTDRVKEGMFSSIQFDLPGARVLDLFAGSGQLGIEALSRGAAEAVFVDQSKASLSTVRENLTRTRLTDKARLFQREAMQYLKSCPEQCFDIVFLDPPYHKGILEKIIPELCRLLRPGGKIVAEHEKNCKIAEEIFNLRLQREYFYGKIVVTVLLLPEEVEA